MPRLLDARIGRLARNRAFGDADRQAAARERGTLRARAKIGRAIRGALGGDGTDPTLAVALRRADEAEAALAAIPDTAELARADAEALASDIARLRVGEEALVRKLRSIVGNGPPLDLNNSSLAELFAWSISRGA